jgi:uncharacterized protein
LAAANAFTQDVRLSIDTGGTGGVYYPLGGGTANILSKHVPGWQAAAEVTGAAVANLPLIGAGKQDLGFTCFGRGGAELAVARNDSHRSVSC